MVLHYPGERAIVGYAPSWPFSGGIGILPYHGDICAVRCVVIELVGATDRFDSALWCCMRACNVGPPHTHTFALVFFFGLSTGGLLYSLFLQVDLLSYLDTWVHSTPPPTPTTRRGHHPAALARLVPPAHMPAGLCRLPGALPAAPPRLPRLPACSLPAHGGSGWQMHDVSISTPSQWLEGPVCDMPFLVCVLTCCDDL